MKELIQQATLIYPGHEKNGKKVDVLIQNEKVIALQPTKEEAKEAKVRHEKGLLLFPSLVDVFCSSGEPGFEDREDFNSLCQAARNGGFRHLFVLPDTNPVTDSKSEASYIFKNGSLNGVSIYPLGAVSKNIAGESLSEMYDMYQTGVRAFTDGYTSISDVNLMKRALDYTRGFNGFVMSFPYDERLAPGGMVNESTRNTALGIKSSPALSECLMINRDLYLLEYTTGKLHIAALSTAESVRLVKEAKKKKLHLSAGVSMASLLFTEDQLEQFDTSFKVLPHLRGEADRKALIKGLKDGSIDVITSAHRSETVEHKDVEFDHAAFGMTMLETYLSAYNTHLADALSWEDFIHASALAPRALMGIEMPDLSEGAGFDFTLFDPTQEWVYGDTGRATKGQNSPFLGQTLKGKVIR
jgi:dihydroorotase